MRGIIFTRAQGREEGKLDSQIRIIITYVEIIFLSNRITFNVVFFSVCFSAQSYPIQLPNDFECVDCTIRLLREAAEWSNNYRFWSCADVDIRSKFGFSV